MDVSRILDLLATQIYDTPYALLRENVQNAYDAILMREASQISFEPRIDVTITESYVRVEDNGIGMSVEQLAHNFWTAGSSGKNTDEARAAGVVGTFGIGGLANFGMCKTLTVITETIAGQRTRSIADRDNLSLEKNCISIEDTPSTGKPGTIVLAELPRGTTININDATNYLRTFVNHLRVPVFVNGEKVSMRPIDEAVPPKTKVWGTTVSVRDRRRLVADIDIRISESGNVWLHMTNLILDGSRLVGEVVLKQGMGQIMAYRNGFGLAFTGVSSNYQFGGAADLNVLQPTAGRDALTTQSVQLLQTIVSETEQLVGPVIAESQLIDLNTPFMNWIVRNGRFDLCYNLKATVLPSNVRLGLQELAQRSQKIQINAYQGDDEAMTRAYASEESPLIKIARTNPRAQCEIGFLSKYARINFVSDEPKILKSLPDSSWSIPQAALAIRIAVILETDYFIKTRIQFGTISHNLPFVVNVKSQPIVLTLSSNHPALAALIQCYDTDFNAFGAFVKDFVRIVDFSTNLSISSK